MDEFITQTVTAMGETQNLIALGQFLVAAIVGIATFLIFSHSRRKDKLDFFRSNWDKQQDLNLFCIGNNYAAETVERMVYGDDHEVDEGTVRDFNFTFIQLNKIQNNFQAYKFGVLSHREFVDMSIPSLQLLVRKKELVMYVVVNRGYSPEFQKFIINNIKDLEPFDIPTMEAGQFIFDHAAENVRSFGFSERMESFLSKFDRLGDRLIDYKLDYIFIINPIILFAQCYRVVKQQDASQISFALIIGFILVNLVTMIVAAQVRKPVMFLAFFASFIASILLLGLRIIL